MIDAATLCMADLKTVLQSIAKLKGKIVQVYDHSELQDKAKPLKLPACGIIYEGMRSVGESGSSAKLGTSCELVASIIMMDTLTNMGAANTYENAPAILDAIREGMMGRRSPTGHFWKFIVEAAAQPSHGTVLWVQRWSCPVQLVSAKY
jgi:hypothetical protein